MSSNTAAMILAAGKGTRMRSEMAKVLHPLLGQSLVEYSIHACLELQSTPTVIVVGHQAQAVENQLSQRFPGQLRFALQAEQLGTGHAASIGLTQIPEAEHVLILAGDVPLLTAATLKALVKAAEAPAALSLLTMRLAVPTGYGRILRHGPQNEVSGIVEHKDASEAERAIQEVNAGIYCVNRAFLSDALSALKQDNAQGEYYLTDIVKHAAEAGRLVRAVEVADPIEVSGVNHLGQLAELETALRRRINHALMLAGVRLEAPESIFIEPSVTVEPGARIGASVHLRGQTVVKAGAWIDVGSVITDSVVGEGVIVKPYSIFEAAIVEKEAIIGPFSRLRPGAKVMEAAHVGNFVELKKTTLGQGAKANHLAYLGDAIIGARSNVGAGTITCNYDGYGKHLTELGEDVFVGSNSTLVAPIQVGDRAYLAAGSTLTDPVPADALSFGRARQTDKPGRAVSLREAAKAKAQAAKAKK